MTFKSHIDANAFSRQNEPYDSTGITLAVSAHWNRFPEKFNWITEHGFALEYAPNPSHLDNVKAHLSPYIDCNVPVRHHAYFPGYEIGDPDRVLAEKAMMIHLKALYAIKGIGNQTVTVHVGLTPDQPLDHDRVIKNLSALVAYGKGIGIQVNLENLRFGPTSHPETLLEWTKRSGAKITLDIGHAVSCDRVRQGDFTVPEIVELFSSKLDEVHLYESETNTHHAPQDLSILGPILDRLVRTNCRWWTIELDAYPEILHTRQLVLEYLSQNRDGISLLKSVQTNGL